LVDLHSIIVGRGSSISFRRHFRRGRRCMNGLLDNGLLWNRSGRRQVLVDGRQILLDDKRVLVDSRQVLVDSRWVPADSRWVLDGGQVLDGR
jgi:hypothetical protein